MTSRTPPKLPHSVPPHGLHLNVMADYDRVMQARQRPRPSNTALRWAGFALAASLIAGVVLWQNPMNSVEDELVHMDVLAELSAGQL